MAFWLIASVRSPLIRQQLLPAASNGWPESESLVAHSIPLPCATAGLGWWPERLPDFQGSRRAAL